MKKAIWLFMVILVIILTIFQIIQAQVQVAENDTQQVYQQVKELLLGERLDTKFDMRRDFVLSISEWRLVGNSGGMICKIPEQLWI